MRFVIRDMNTGNYLSSYNKDLKFIFVPEELYHRVFTFILPNVDPAQAIEPLLRVLPAQGFNIKIEQFNATLAEKCAVMAKDYKALERIRDETKDKYLEDIITYSISNNNTLYKCLWTANFDKAIVSQNFESCCKVQHLAKTLTKEQCLVVERTLPTKVFFIKEI